MNNDPSMQVSIGDEEFSANRRNTFLYTFLGELGIHDHIFLVTDPVASEGTFIFKVVHTQDYEEMAAFMVKNSYVAHLNAFDVSQCDADAFKRATMGDLEDTIPENWG